MGASARGTSQNIRTSAGEPEDHPGAVREEHSDPLVLGHTAVDRVRVLEIIDACCFSSFVVPCGTGMHDGGGVKPVLHRLIFFYAVRLIMVVVYGCCCCCLRIQSAR